jgi:hypothetical protein
MALAMMNMTIAAVAADALTTSGICFQARSR